MRDTRIDAFRGLMMLMVVAIHAFDHAGLTGMTADISWALVSTIATAGFFAADGFLLAGNRGRQSRPWRYVLAQDIRRLLVPWLVFSLAYGALYIAIKGLPAIPLHLFFWQSVAAPQLYFLPALFVIRIVFFLLARWQSPVLCFLPCLAIIAFYAQVEPCYLAHFPPVGIDPMLQALRGFGFFWLGFHLALLRQTPPTKRLINLMGMAGIMLVAVPITVLSWYHVAQLAALVVTGALFLRWPLPGNRYLVSIGKETMPIFLLHAPVTLKALTAVMPNLLPPLVVFLVLIAASTALSILGAIILRHFGMGWIFGESLYP